ncbi:hypothetical protein CMT42_09915 [Elizabethkingia anophelis]|uniref:Uncharacterized protein n=2 Tax=Elizabethkingia anophelis TaxID=1117645 RepID=A0ABM6MTU5_9FLAO|nr:hypothetical protein [Elizabethkingia anophelis]ATC36538.1 hypothetical protein BAZ09_010075 [Elizabethkingia anophelis R26]ATC40215.1 hypothetical protein EAAG1_010290 [Elizabethkingia anophelis Ag1]ATC43893.1 hypothetical protein CMV41_10290 [Elizabethkingia anophelis]ATC47569.1 hypothetical protein CMV40_10290 [Elizabethkingia anophelis]ELB0068145.1 hypothetical protein [Elizabethkingia anophelis]
MKKLILLSLIILSGWSYACVCMIIPNPIDQFNDYDFIANITIADTNIAPKGYDKQYYIADIKINKLYKGRNVKQLFVDGHLWKKIGKKSVRSGSMTSCSFQVTPGENYIVFANLKTGKYTIGSCNPHYIKEEVYRDRYDRVKETLDFVEKNKISSKLLNDYEVVKRNKQKGDYSRFEQFNNIDAKSKFAALEIENDEQGNITNGRIIKGFGNDSLDNKILEDLRKFYKVKKRSSDDVSVTIEKKIFFLYYYPKKKKNQTSIMSDFIL